MVSLERRKKLQPGSVGASHNWTAVALQPGWPQTTVMRGNGPNRCFWATHLVTYCVGGVGRSGPKPRIQTVKGVAGWSGTWKYHDWKIIPHLGDWS